jgi:hypothetical protein
MNHPDDPGCQGEEIDEPEDENLSSANDDESISCPSEFPNCMVFDQGIITTEELVALRKIIHMEKWAYMGLSGLTGGLGLTLDIVGGVGILLPEPNSTIIGAICVMIGFPLTALGIGAGFEAEALDEFMSFVDNMIEASQENGDKLEVIYFRKNALDLTAGFAYRDSFGLIHTHDTFPFLARGTNITEWIASKILD